MNDLQLTYSTRLMEEHRMATSVTAHTEFLADRGPAGELDLFYMGKRKDHSDAIYNLQREAGSETGWRHCDLGNSFVPGGIASGLDPANGDTQVVFAFEDNPYGISLYLVKELEPGTWDAWQFLDPDVIGAPSGWKVKAIRAERIDGALQLFAVLGPRPGEPFRPDEVWMIPWKTFVEGCQCLGQVSSMFMKYVNVNGLGEGLLVTDQPESGQPGEDLVFVKAGDTPVCQRIAHNVPTHLLSVEEQQSGYSVIFLRDDPVRVKETPVLFIDCASTQRGTRSIEGTEKIIPKQLLAVDAEALPLTLYIVNEDNCLYITKQQDAPSGGELVWMPPLPLGYRFRYVAGGINKDGYAQVFGLSAQPGAEDRLECIFKSPPIEGEEMAPAWQWCTIDLPVQTMETVQVYGTELVITDGEGCAWSQKPVWIAANEMVDVEVCYRHYYLGPRNWEQVTTDAAGRVTLISRTRSLDGPKWLVRKDQPNTRVVAAADVDLCVDAAEQTMARLKGMTEDDVRTVLPPETRGDADKVHEAIGKLMEYHAAAMPATASASFYTRLDPTRLADGAWQLTIDKDGVRLREIDSAYFERLVSQTRAEPENFFHDLIQWFTDAAQAVANGIVAAVEYTFNKVTEGVQAVIKLVTDAFTWVFEGVIKFAEQVVQIAETVFNAAKAYFEDLFTKFFGLILEPFLQDVRAAAGFMEDHFLDLLNKLIGTVEQAKPHVTDFFDKQHTKLDQDFDKLLAALGDETFNYRLLQNGALYAAPVAGLDGGTIADTAQGVMVFSDYFARKAQSPAAQVPGGFDPGEELRTAIRDFLNTIREGLTDKMKEEMDALQEFVETRFDSPEQLLQATLKLVLETMRNLVSLTLDFGKAVAKGFLDLVALLLKSFKKFVFDTPITNGILQTLYKLAYPDAKPEELTFGRLFFLLCGAPVAICWRVLFMKPFGKFDEVYRLPLYGPDAMPSAAPIVWSRLSADEQVDVAKVTGGILKIFPGSFFKVLFDVSPTMPGWVTMVGGALLPLTMVVLGTPTTLFTDWSPDTVAFWDNGAWVLSTVSPTLALLLCSLPGSEGLTKVTAVFDAFMGVLCMGGNVAKMIAHVATGHYSDASLYAACVEPLSPIAHPLKYAGEKGLAVVILIDIICDWGGGAADIISGVLPAEAILEPLA